MTLKNLKILYDDLRIENETLKNFIKMTNGQEALDRVLMEVAIQRTNEVLSSYNKNISLQKYI